MTLLTVEAFTDVIYVLKGLITYPEEKQKEVDAEDQSKSNVLDVVEVPCKQTLQNGITIPKKVNHIRTRRDVGMYVGNEDQRARSKKKNGRGKRMKEN